MKNKKTIFFIFLLILLAGLQIRLYQMFAKDVFTDEVMYSEISLKYHMADIIKVNHRIKDNGFLYYFYLKLFLPFTNNIQYLRLSNIPLYIISVYYIYRLFELLKYKYLSLIPVFIYAFLTYFVYMNTMISTYNLAICFAAIFIYFIFKLAFDSRLKNSVPSYGLLLLIMVAGFYTNYSFIYVMFLLIPIMIFMFFTKREKIPALLVTLTISLIFILPGVAQIIRNYQSVISFNLIDAYQEFRPYYFFCNFTDTLLLRNGNILSMIVFGLLIFYRVFCFFKKSCDSNFSVIIVGSLFLSFVFIYYVNNYVSIIFFERAFWFFYLIMTFFIADFLKLLFAQKKTLLAILLTVMIVFWTFFRFNSRYYQIFLPGNVNDFTSYQQLITSLFKERARLNTKNLVIIDSGNKYYPLLRYYFSDIYKNNDSFFAKIKEYKKKVNIYKINNVNELDNQTLKHNTTYILFNPESQYVAYLLKSINNIRSTAYILEDTENNDLFKKIYSYYD